MNCKRLHYVWVLRYCKFVVATSW